MQLFIKCFTELRSNVSPVGNSLCLLLQTAALERSLGNVSIELCCTHIGDKNVPAIPEILQMCQNLLVTFNGPK